MSEDASGTRALKMLGLASLFFYVALTVFFWTAWSFKSRVIDQVLLVVAAGSLVGLYFWGLKFVPRAATSTVVLFAIAVGIVGFLTPPFDSTDVFFYMATGWQQAHYGSNPYSELLRSVDGAMQDPMIQNEWMSRNRNPWLDIPMPYGFLFAILSRGIAWLGGGNFWLTLSLFSLLNGLMHAGIAWFLWQSGKLLPEGSGKIILYLYTWNPFVVLQYLGDLHNDIIVAFFVVVAAYLLLKDRTQWSVPLLVAAGLIKYVTLVLVPFALIYLIRRKGWRASVNPMLVSAALVLITTAPYIGDLTSFKFGLIWAQLSESTGSLHAFGVYSFRALGRLWPPLTSLVSDFEIASRIGLWVLFASFVVIQLYKAWNSKVEEPVSMIQRWTSILFGLVFVASSQFYAWYLGMLFPLALLTHRKTILTDCIILLSGAHMLSFTFLRRKAIGYFVIATLLPVLYLVAQKRYSRARTVV
jgi:hypothetical protein